MRNELWEITLVATLGACLAAAACSRNEPADTPATAAPAKPLPPAATMHPDDVAAVTASYDCDGIRVDVIRDAVARVNLAVDNIVKIERIEGSTPATYQDVGLTLVVTDTGATLDDENGRSLACVPVAKPESPGGAGD